MKKLLNSILAVTMAFGLVACSSSGTSSSTSTAETGSDEATGSVTDGTYSASAEGFGGDVTVTLTVAEGAISEASIEGKLETETVGQAAIPTLQEEIVDNQTWDIDIVSGATLTSNAVKDATKAAMTEAGFTIEEKEAVVGEDETVDIDVLVIGMGASGTMAAINAAESGASVLGVEATGTLGGMGNAAQGMFAVGSVLQKERYGEDGETTDEEYWYNVMIERTQNLGNAELIRRFISEAKNTVSYLLDKGVAVYLSEQPQQIAHFDTETVYHRWNNTEPFKYLGAALDENGVEVMYNTTATELLTDDSGAVVGAICTKEDGGTLTVNAKAVVLSTGSFANNPELMKETLGDVVYNNAMVMAGSELPGLDMAWNVGAAKGELLTMNHGVVTMGAGDETASELTLNTPILWVNSRGERFMNEDLLKDTVEFSSAVVAQGGLAYTIVDQATVDRWTDETQENTGTWIHYWDQNGIIDENGERTIYHAPIAKEDWDSSFEQLEEAGEGKVCETLEEVAEFIGCDLDTLTETVTNYNTYVENGYDEQFFKSAESLVYSVEEGPFYVTKGHSGVLGALGGVNTTKNLEVVKDDGTVIPGLYATGNNVSGISVAAYQAIEGVGLGFSLTSGRLAGVAAAEYATE